MQMIFDQIEMEAAIDQPIRVSSPMLGDSVLERPLQGKPDQ